MACTSASTAVFADHSHGRQIGLARLSGARIDKVVRELPVCRQPAPPHRGRSRHRFVAHTQDEQDRCPSRTGPRRRPASRRRPARRRGPACRRRRSAATARSRRAVVAARSTVQPFAYPPRSIPDAGRQRDHIVSPLCRLPGACRSALRRSSLDDWVGSRSNDVRYPAARTLFSTVGSNRRHHGARHGERAAQHLDAASARRRTARRRLAFSSETVRSRAGSG